MTRLSITSTADKLSLLLKRSPETLTRHLSVAVERSALEVSRSARRSAPKAFSTLTNAITQRIEAGGLEAVISANVDYAAMVEYGTGPGGMPSNQAILDWIKVKRIEPEQGDARDLAFLIRRKIARDGTPAQPFMKPAFDDHKADIEARLNRAINTAFKEFDA